MTDPFTPCIVVPYYNHGHAIGETVLALRESGLRTFIVDDGSARHAREALEHAAEGQGQWLTVLHLPENRGKGAAVMSGCEAAVAAGYTHALQVDADGQHDFNDIPGFLALSRESPGSVVTGIPVFDDSIPRSRLHGRYLTHVWVWVHTLSRDIRDSMCGYRVYPLRELLAVWREGGVGSRMDFDIEILVRLYWRGLEVRGLPTRVRYPESGISHFELWGDNLRITAMHTRLFFGMIARIPRLVARRLGGSR